MTKVLECDVLIVGGGPAGLSVASHLSDDICSIVVHQDKEIGKPVRTSGGTWVSDMQELSIPEHLYQVITHLDFYSANEVASFSLQHDQAAVLDVTGLYQYLATLSKNKNCRLMTGSKFISSKKSPDGRYYSTIRSRSEGELTIASTYIIDASGWHCAVLESLGLGKKPERLGVGIEYEFPIGDFDPQRAILFVGSMAPGGYGWVFPTPGQRLRVGVGNINTETDLTPKQVMQAFIDNGHCERLGITIPEKYHINAGIVPSVAYEKQMIFGNVIRTGDSANFATPAVGEGIRIAIKFGRLLGLELSNHMHGDRRALKRYESTCTRTFNISYKIGFMINQRIARSTAEQLDGMVKRFSRLQNRAATKLLRHEFDGKRFARMVWDALKRKVLRSMGADSTDLG